MIALSHIGFLHEIDDGPGGNVRPDVGDMGSKLLSEIDIVEEGTTARVRVFMVWKHRPIADEILAPCSKSSTAACTLPENGSGMVGGLCPPHTGGVGREEPIEMT